MKFSKLGNVRVKLDESGGKEFWRRVNEFGGVKTFSEAFSIPSSKIYNWKSKDSFIPIKLVKKVFGNEGSTHVEAIKGPGRSKPIKDPVFPIPENNELLTRISCSVSVSSKGIPLYQASDRGLVNRFIELLSELGDVPVKIYEREVYELRYPKYLHEIFQEMSYEKDLGAMIDEVGEFEKNKVVLGGEEIEPRKLEKLYHREKRLKLALIREDNKEIAKLMTEEKEKVRKALNQI